MEFLVCISLASLKGQLRTFLLHYTHFHVETAFPKAPAKRFAEQGDALQEELGPSTSALHSSTKAVVKGTIKNASRQYQIAVRRLGMAMTLGLYLSDLGLVPVLLPSSFSISSFLILLRISLFVGPTSPKENPNIHICAPRRRACRRDAISETTGHFGLLAEGRSLAPAGWNEPWTRHECDAANILGGIQTIPPKSPSLCDGRTEFTGFVLDNSCYGTWRWCPNCQEAAAGSGFFGFRSWTRYSQRFDMHLSKQILLFQRCIQS